MATSLDSVAATLVALQTSNDEAHRRIETQLERLTNLVYASSDRITRLEEQQRVRTGGLAALSLIASTVAGWLGMQK